MANLSATIKHFVCLLSILLIMIISTLTTVYGDDLIFGTFCLDGVKAFLKNSYNHYIEMNGRAFINFVLSIVLAFRDHLFIIVIPGMLLALFASYMAICGKNYKHIEKVEILALFFMGIMCLSKNILREGLLWMSGAMNYVFPTVFSLLGFFLFKRIVDKNTLGIWDVIVLFLCGATTEQSGVVLLCCCILYLIYDIYDCRHVILKSVFAFSPIVFGYLTVVLSPGTSNRIKAETSSIKIGIFEKFDELFSLTLGKNGACWIFLVCLVLFALRSKMRFVKTVGMVAAIAALTFLLFEKISHSGWIITIALVVVSISKLFNKEHVVDAILILAALVSVAMLAMSTTYGYRNMMPCVLILILVASSCICEFLSGKKYSFVAFSMAFLFAFFAFYPTLTGYIKNREVINENLSNISNSNEGFYFNVDFDQEYAYMNYHSVYMDGYRRIYGIDKDTKIYFKGEDFRDLYYKGVHCQNSIYKNDYFPLREIIELENGIVEYDESTNTTLFIVNGKEVLYNINTREFSDGTNTYDGNNFLKYDNKYPGFFITTTYFHREGFRLIFGIDLPE